ncbi:MAG: hypothetical protein IJK92_09240 [Bacteroidales bacterium]|nr:hypothetical protein [Bacteroidales bacterium]
MNKHKLNRIFFCFIYLLALLSCKNEQNSLWVETEEGFLVYIRPSSDNCIYSWQGDTFENVVNGKGELLVFDSLGNVSLEQIEAYYGAFDDKLIKTTKNGGKYIGSLDDDNNLSGFGVLIENGNLLVGSFEHGKPNGELKQYKEGKLFYDGYWKLGSFDGDGVLYKQDGTVIRGLWENNKLISSNVDVELPSGRYFGNVKDGKPSSYGEMYYLNGSRYVGYWENGYWSGEGYYVSPSDSINGEWFAGKLNGHAFVSTQDFSYDGDWISNAPDGFGIVVFPDSTYYDGAWENGRRNGYGGLVASNGDKYFGDWENDLFNGQGSYEFSNGDYYVGEWEEGLQNGEGKYVSDLFTYVGSWKDGWMNGNGTIQYANGDVYEGNFVENERYGEGVYQFANGHVYEGEFVDNKFHGLGKFYFNDGSIYEGEFFEGKIDGDGTLVLVIEEDTLAITANWDGSGQLPKFASLLFSNGDLYEGELVDGHPTDNGTWTNIQEEEESRFVKVIKNANEYYKSHRETINKAVIITSAAIVAVAVVATGGATLVAAAPVAKVLATVATVATTTSSVINVVDAGVSIASASLDGDWTTTAMEVGFNAAFIAIPHVAPLLKNPARKACVLLSKSARTVLKPVRTNMVNISKSEAFRKIVTITKKDGTLQKTARNASKKKVKEVAKKSGTNYLKRAINKSLLQKEVNEILDKGPIKLSKKNLSALLENPNYLRAYIKTYTGKSRNFQEFFIRLSMGSKEQVKLLMENETIKQYVDKSIRAGGGYHEWLMVRNYTDFLTNPKWGDDGPYLSIALTRLVQRTNLVLFKTGGGHGSTGSTIFHNGLAKVIWQCSSKEELLQNIRKYAKEQLTDESYKEFEQIFIKVLS